MTDQEHPLTGGRTRIGVVRTGSVVCRPPHPNGEFVRSLLQHLEAAGFEGAPKYIGCDEQNREMLSYLPGDVPDELGHHGDAVLLAAAQLIRRFHDATQPLFSSEACRSAGIEIACHNDLSPCNAVFRGGLPIAFIDFDAASPGSRHYDLGYAAWLWLDLGNSDYSAAEQLRRLDLFLEAYGHDQIDRAAVLEAILQRQAVIVAEAVRIGNSEMQVWAKGCRRWTEKNLISSG